MEPHPQPSLPLRIELEPQVAVAVQRYPQAMALLAAYDEASDAGNDLEVEAVAEKLRHLTEKDISVADLYEYYEASSKEELAIRLAMPAPLLVGHVTRAELLEVLRRLREAAVAPLPGEVLPLAEQIRRYYLHDYYHNFLKLHFPGRYRYQYFNRCKGADGRYGELSVEELASKLLA